MDSTGGTGRKDRGLPPGSLPTSINHYARTVESQSGMTDLIVKSAVKEALENQNISADFYEAFDKEVAELVDEAAERADANDRKTVQARDL